MSIEPVDLVASYKSVVAAGKGPCWDGYKQVGMKKGKNGNMVPNCVPKDSSDATETEFAKAPKKDRIYGSKRNPKGSAKGGKKIVFSARTEATLREKVTKHNAKAPDSRKATLGMLKAVYRRGAGAFSSSHRPGMTRDGWAYARVNAFLRLLKSGRPANPNYKQDNDLLPKGHPRSSTGDASVSMIASLYVNSQLYGELQDESEYYSPEHAIFAMAELSGEGYEIIPALRAAWLRAISNNESPFDRAAVLASALYESRDADLLPIKEQ